MINDNLENLKPDYEMDYIKPQLYYQKIPKPASNGHVELSPLVIDDYGGGNYTWEEAANETWCSGKGWASEPYIIENVLIDGENASDCIEIKNSNASFIIRNCHFQNTDSSEWASGVKLLNTFNGKVIDNNYTNAHNSIHLELCKNITISNNDILYTVNITGFGRGITIVDSSNLIISSNELNDHYDGIVLWECHNNLITHNFISTRRFGHYPDTGLYLWRSNYSTVTFNTFAGDYANFADPFNGSIINEDNCLGNVIVDNFNVTGQISGLQMQNPGSWFQLTESNYNYISGNNLLKDKEPVRENIIPGYNITFFIGILMFISIIIMIKKLVYNRRFNKTDNLKN